MQKTGPSKPVSGGSIIATASTAGIRSGAGSSKTLFIPNFNLFNRYHTHIFLAPADYSASKAAVISIMQTSAFQLAGTNVRCNAICPGLIETGMTGAIWEMARKRGTEGKIGQINPLKRGGVSDEIARVALFLGSDEFVALSHSFFFDLSETKTPSRPMSWSYSFSSSFPLPPCRKKCPNTDEDYVQEFICKCTILGCRWRT